MLSEDLLAVSLARGIESASTVLGDLSAGQVSVAAANVRESTAAEVLEALGNSDVPVLGIYVGFDGGLSGHALLLMTQDGATRVANHLLGDPPNGPDQSDVLDPDALARSALEELGNIVISAVLNEVGRPLSEPIHPTVPRVAIDMAGAILSSVVVDLVEDVDELTVGQAIFTESGQAFDGWLFILPRRASDQAERELASAG
jgi:chemotaxis protein CheC